MLTPLAGVEAQHHLPVPQTLPMIATNALMPNRTCPSCAGRLHASRACSSCPSAAPSRRVSGKFGALITWSGRRDLLQSAPVPARLVVCCLRELVASPPPPRSRAACGCFAIAISKSCPWSIVVHLAGNFHGQSGCRAGYRWASRILAPQTPFALALSPNLTATTLARGKPVALSISPRSNHRPPWQLASRQRLYHAMRCHEAGAI